MKRVLLSLFLTLLCHAAAISISNAGILIGSGTAIITPTTNSSTFLTNTVQISLPQITVYNSGLQATNDYTGSFRWSIDMTTFYTNGSPQFQPPNTNNTLSTGVGVTIASRTLNLPIYVQMLATTNAGHTGTISVGVTSP